MPRSRRPTAAINKATKETLPRIPDVATDIPELVFLWSTTNIWYELARIDGNSVFPPPPDPSICCLPAIEPMMVSHTVNFHLCQMAPFIHLGLCLILAITGDIVDHGMAAAEGAESTDSLAGTSALDNPLGPWVNMGFEAHRRIKWVSHSSRVPKAFVLTGY